MNILLPDSWLREYLDTDATPAQIKECLALCGPSVEKVSKVDNDYIYDIEITSNRVDMASVYGIAREAAAILPRFGLKAALKSPKDTPGKDTPGVALDDSPGVKESKSLAMNVSDPSQICNRIMGIVMEVEQMEKSPMYVKERLEKSGVRSLNNLVDITNYVMLEVGHPCHVFDYDRIKTHKFLIRFAKAGEQIITLDQKKYLLNSEDVIIDDGTGRVIDLPGIMGTENSVVTKNTRRIFFFIESNNPLFIRKTSMRYGIRTMAAAINEKHPDPELVKTALLRGIELYQKLAGGKVAGEIIDIYPNKSKPATIKTTVEFINTRLGIELKKSDIVSILESLSFTVGDQDTPGVAGKQGFPRGGGISITPPTFRQFDVTIPEDIVEEVARIYGYHNLPGRLMTGDIPVTDLPASEAGKPRILQTEEKIKQILKYWGYTEVYNYSFISKELIAKAQLKPSDHLKIANPLTSEIEYMRISLIPSMLEIISKNQPYSDNLQLFELANVYIPTPRGWQKPKDTPGVALDDSPGVEGSEKGLPLELSMLTITNQKDFYEMKGLVETLLTELGIQNVILSAAKNPLHGSETGGDPSSRRYVGTQDDAMRHFWHPKQTLSIEGNNKIFAVVGRIHPQLTQNFQLKNDLYLAILNVEIITNLANPAKSYTPIPLYPAVIEDITISYPLKTYIGPVISEIYKVSKLVKNVEVIDRYKNSTTLRITYQSKEGNLTSKDVIKVRDRIFSNLKHNFKIILK